MYDPGNRRSHSSLWRTLVRIRYQEVPMTLLQLLDRLQSDPRLSSPIAAWKTIPARPASSSPFPDAVNPHLVRALHHRGIESLYTHQAEAFSAVHAGEHIVVVTPTASGKTLCTTPSLSFPPSRERRAPAWYPSPPQGRCLPWRWKSTNIRRSRATPPKPPPQRGGTRGPPPAAPSAPPAMSLSRTRTCCT